MNNIATVRKGLSPAITAFLILLLAIASRVLLQIHFSVADDDEAYQVQAAYNFLNGHGLTIKEALSGDVSKTEFVPLVKWPPGYSFLLTPFLLLCKQNFFLATVLLEIVTAIFFVIITRKLLAQAGVHNPWLNLSTLVSGFFIYEFCSTWVSSTDFIAITLFLVAVYMSVLLLTSTRHPFWRCLLLSFILFYTAFTRYMFLPVVFIPPAYILVYGILSKEKQTVKNGIVVFVSLTLLLTAFFLLLKYYTGAYNYVAPTENGFFPSHLLRVYPFVLSSVIDVNFICVQFEKITGIPFLAIAAVFVWLNYVLLFLIIVATGKWLFSKWNYPRSASHHYIWLCLFSCLVLIGLLVWLSLTKAAVRRDEQYDWSFVQEGRYFGLVTVFGQHLVFLLLQYKPVSTWKKLFLRILLVCMLFSSLHGAYYLTKSFFSGDSFFARKKNIELMHYSQRLLEQTIASHPGKTIIAVSQQPFFNNFAALTHDVAGYYRPQDILAGKIQTSKPILIYLWSIESLATGRYKKIGVLENNNFYLAAIEPASSQ